MSRGKAGGADGLSIDLMKYVDKRSILLPNAYKPLPYKVLGKIL